MSRWRYGGVGALMLALLGGVVWCGRGRAPSPPLGEEAQRAVVAGAEDPRAAPSLAAPDVPIAEPVGAAPEERPAPIRLAQLEARLARLEQQTQALTEQQHALAEQWGRLRQSATPPGVGSAAARIEDAAPEADDDALAVERAAVQDRITTLETAFAAQAPDPRWSPQAVDHITHVLNSDALSGTTLANLACATTLCRLEVRHDDEDSRDRFMSEIFPALGWQTKAYSQAVTQTDGGFTTVLYVAREGYSLPPISK